MIQLSTALKLLLTLMTVPVTGTIDLSPIDNTDGEWVAPGYEVITELDFDPLEYVDYVQAAQAFFMDTEDGEQLRLILVGDNRVLVFDEPWDSYREYAIEEPWVISNIVFARNGRFLAVCARKDSIVSYPELMHDAEFTKWTGFRIEITQDGFNLERYESKPGNSEYMYYISNEGRVSASNGRGIISLLPQGDFNAFLSRSNEYTLWRRRACSYDSTIIAFGNDRKDDGIYLRGFDWSGSLLWETPTGDRNLTSLRASPSGDYILAPARNGGVVCYSGEDGTKLWETAEDLMCDYPQFSPSGERWIMSPDEVGHFYFFTGNLKTGYDHESITAYEIVSDYFQNPVCLNVNDSGNALIWMQSSSNSHHLQLLYLDPEQNIVWAPEMIRFYEPRPAFNLSSPAWNAESYFYLTIAGISHDGNRICYTDFNSIKVLRFEEVN